MKKAICIILTMLLTPFMIVVMMAIVGYNTAEDIIEGLFKSKKKR